jgi:hypothetical protein
MSRRVLTMVALGLVALFLGCATRFSPERIRAEIQRQTGRPPLRSIEIDLDNIITRLLMNAIAASKDAQKPLPLAGLTGIQFGSYELEKATGPEARRFDATRIQVRGWEKVVRAQEPGRSIVVLIRERGDVLRDVVLVASSEDGVLYARMRGRLSSELPGALEGSLRKGGLEGLKKLFLSLVPSAEGEQQPAH